MSQVEFFIKGSIFVKIVRLTALAAKGYRTGMRENFAG